MDFTYEIPDEEKFLWAVVMRIKIKGNPELASLLSESKCSITTSSDYSKKRWNAYYTTVDFAVPLNNYEKALAKISGEYKEIVKETCNEVMPPKVGYDVMDVTVSISLEDRLQKADTLEDLKDIISKLPSKVKDIVIPEDILEKAKEMSEVYLYTYCAENSIRLFIEKVAEKNYGTDHLSKLKLNSKMQDKIKTRKDSQAKTKWVSARGSSDIFYLDIDDLACVIANNWGIFKDYFSSYGWIETNIKEIADCRNPVAHHSYLQEHEREIIRLNFIKILKQISETFK